MCRDSLVGRGWSVRSNVCFQTWCEVHSTVPLTWMLCSNVHQAAAAAAASTQGGAGLSPLTSKVHSSSHPEILGQCPRASRACTEMAARCMEMLTSVQEACVLVIAEVFFTISPTQLSAPTCRRRHLATRPRHSSRRPPAQPVPSLMCQPQLPRCCLPCRWETCTVC